MKRRELLSMAAAGAAALTATAAGAAEGESSTPGASPIGEDCVCNNTGEAVIVRIVSKHGHTPIYLAADTCAPFLFVDDGKLKVLAAFTLNNELVTFYPFLAINQPSACLSVAKNLKQAEPLDKDKRSHKKMEAKSRATNEPV